MPQSTVRIDSDIVRQLRAYSEATGVPITRCLEEAATTWLRDVAPVRLKALGTAGKKR